MRGAGADKGVDAPLRRRRHRARRRLDVGFVEAREGADARAFDLLGDPLHGGRVAGRCGGETGFDNVDVQIAERPGDHELGLHGHGKARRLFAVAQGGVENAYMRFAAG